MVYYTMLYEKSFEFWCENEKVLFLRHSPPFPFRSWRFSKYKDFLIKVLTISCHFSPPLIIFKISIFGSNYGRGGTKGENIFRPVQESQSSIIYYRPSLLCGNFYFQFKRALTVNKKSSKNIWYKTCPTIVFVVRKLDLAIKIKTVFP
jgi:predicted RNase H-like nuclease